MKVATNKRRKQIWSDNSLLKAIISKHQTSRYWNNINIPKIDMLQNKHCEIEEQ